MTILIDTVIKGRGGHCSNHKRFRTVLFDTVVKDKVGFSICVSGVEIIQFDVVVKGQQITLRNVVALGLFCLTQL